VAGVGRSAKRREARRKAIARLWKLRGGVDSYADILDAAIEVERVSRKSLLGIHDLAAGGTLGKFTDKQLFEHFGYSGEPVDWPVGDDEGYDKLGTFESRHSGGTTSWLRDPHGHIRTVVILRPVNSPGFDIERAKAADLAIFYHEVGHVDDFEKRLNFVDGRKVNLCAAEIYAHEFACRKMLQGDVKAAIGFYTGNAIPQLATMKVRPVADAAKSFLQSSMYRACKEVAGEHHHYWVGTYGSS
jgi:hypothetical protein